MRDVLVLFFVSIFYTYIHKIRKYTCQQNAYHTQCDTTRQTLSRSYGRCFAEFLEELSPVRLSLLDSTTCVGLRYGSHLFKLRGFSWRALHTNFLHQSVKFSLSTHVYAPRIYLRYHAYNKQHQSNKTLVLVSPVTPSQ